LPILNLCDIHHNLKLGFFMSVAQFLEDSRVAVDFIASISHDDAYYAAPPRFNNSSTATRTANWLEAVDEHQLDLLTYAIDKLQPRHNSVAAIMAEKAPVKTLVCANDYNPFAPIPCIVRLPHYEAPTTIGADGLMEDAASVLLIADESSIKAPLFFANPNTTTLNTTTMGIDFLAR
jgi:hypothetical protein